MEWTNMMDALSNYNSKEILTFYWSNGVIFDGIVDMISETCTCEFEEDDPNYQEYYMCVVKIINVIKSSTDFLFHAKSGDFIEVSALNEPLKIVANGHRTIWEKQQK